MSVVPPGAKGTTIRTGRAGQSVCAQTALGSNAGAARTLAVAASNVRREEDAVGGRVMS
jgi:hypothetical protein